MAEPDTIVARLNAFSDPRFATYVGFYDALRKGMTREQVFATRDRFYPAGGARTQPKLWVDEPTWLLFFMDSEDRGEPGCEGIGVHWRADGTVERKFYSMD